MAVDLQVLVGRLNAPTRASLEAAVGLTLSRTHYNVEIEHWLTKLAEPADTDIAAILRHFGIDNARLQADLTRVLDRFKTGNSRAPSLAPNVVKLMREAWLLASLESGEASVRGGHVLAALMDDDTLSAVARDASRELAKIKGEDLKAALATITASSSEAPQGAATDSAEAPRPRRRLALRGRRSSNIRSTSRPAPAPGRSTRFSAATPKRGRSSIF